ncbi:Mu transposase C-terminal domain-containing protein [Arthrobacter sp. K5]|uniref:Mu transposase C-terminal domain-containing protein n=1 Tax=Arthrobacter sp. K5 TaxID=2839623 RepID=A0AAU8EIT4_9MICC
MPESLENLDGLLLTVPKNRTVQRDGIHFQGQRYLSPTLAPFVGQTVTIRYDPRDISEIRVYDHDTFVCVAVDEDHPNLRLSLRDIEAARRARRRELRRTINDRISTITSREEPHITEPVRRRRRLRTTTRTNDEHHLHRHQGTPTLQRVRQLRSKRTNNRDRPRGRRGG